MAEPPLSRLSEEIRKRRLAAGLSRKKLSAVAGLGETYVSELERGLVEHPRISTLRSIARGLACTVRDLTGEEEGETDEFVDFRRLRLAFNVAAKQLPNKFAQQDLDQLVELGADIYDWLAKEERRYEREFDSIDEVADRLILIRPRPR
jgi:transcriptional regulator with XRE-family HTH domain